MSEKKDPEKVVREIKRKKCTVNPQPTPLPAMGAKGGRGGSGSGFRSRSSGSAFHGPRLQPKLTLPGPLLAFHAPPSS